MKSKTKVAQFLITSIDFHAFILTAVILYVMFPDISLGYYISILGVLAVFVVFVVIKSC